MSELEQILFDVVGEYVDPTKLDIQLKPRGYYWVFSNEKPPVDPQVIYKELDERLKGTLYERKVTLYFPTN